MYYVIQEATGPHLIVAGTAYNGEDGDDFVAMSFEPNGSRTWAATSGAVAGGILYDAPGDYVDDVATGLAKDDIGDSLSGNVYVAGYSVKPAFSFASSGDDVDFTVIALTVAYGTPLWQNGTGRHWASPGSTGSNDDFCWDVACSGLAIPQNYSQLWLVGQANNGTDYDAMVVTFDPGTGASRWDRAYELTDGDDIAYSIDPISTSAFVSGEGTGEDDIQHRVLFQISDSGQSSVLDWDVPYESIQVDNGDGPGLYVRRAPATGNLVVTGLHYLSSGTQWDFGTACYEP